MGETIPIPILVLSVSDTDVKMSAKLGDRPARVIHNHVLLAIGVRGQGSRSMSLRFGVLGFGSWCSLAIIQGLEPLVGCSPKGPKDPIIRYSGLG